MEKNNERAIFLKQEYFMMGDNKDLIDSNLTGFLGNPHCRGKVPMHLVSNKSDFNGIRLFKML
jgi:hypothetical protein